MSVRLQPLDRQVVVITGASSGIGLATAIAAAERGARVVMAARSIATLREIASRIEAGGGEALAVEADVGRLEDVERVAAEAVARFGGIDTWVNNAGVGVYARLRELDEADGRRVFDTNFWGVVHGSRVALRHLAERGGALINLGSEMSDTVVPLQGLYAASKHAVKGYTDALRIELQDEGVPVSVTLIQPTAVNTPYPEHARNRLTAEPMLPPVYIEPQRVADAILHAATTPERDLRIGLLAKVNSFTAQVAPRLMDLVSRLAVDRQQRAEPPLDPAGALERPSEATAAGAGRIRGRGAENAATGAAREAIAQADRALAHQAGREAAPAAGTPRRTARADEGDDDGRPD
jgi:short-subunit dehydrogenase